MGWDGICREKESDFRWDEMGWHGMGWDGMGWDGDRDGMGCHLIGVALLTTTYYLPT